MAYLAFSTQQLCWQLSRLSPIAIATAARPSTFQRRYFAFPFCSYLILESGGAIFDRNFERDAAWDAFLGPQRGQLTEMNLQLRAQGWVLDDEGRTSAIRVRAKDNPDKNEEEFTRLVQEIKLPAGLKKTSNTGHLDIILADAGKDKALSYLAESLGLKTMTDVLGFGDDINDLEMLSLVGTPMLVRSRFVEAMRLAQDRSWRISKDECFAGINELLREAIMMLEK